MKRQTTPLVSYTQPEWVITQEHPVKATLGALGTWRSRDLRSAEWASLITRILHNSLLQSVTGVWNLSKKKKKKKKNISMLPTYKVFSHQWRCLASAGHGDKLCPGSLAQPLAKLHRWHSLHVVLPINEEDKKTLKKKTWISSTRYVFKIPTFERKDHSKVYFKSLNACQTFKKTSTTRDDFMPNGRAPP